MQCVQLGKMFGAGIKCPITKHCVCGTKVVQVCICRKDDDKMPILIFTITQMKTITSRCAGPRSHEVDVFLGCHFGVVVDRFLLIEDLQA